jgi:phosphate transport system protein
VDHWLRLVNTARNLERIGDHATNIAEAVLYLTKGVIVRRATAETDAAL